MGLQGSLKIGGRTYQVVECEYKFSQTIDTTGKPTSRPQGGEITLVIPSTNDDDMFFYNWMFHKSETKSGILRFRLYSNDNKISYKTVSFANAYCIGLRDYFNDNDAKLMYTTIKISAQAIMVGSVNSSVFMNAWTTDSIEMVRTNLIEYVRDLIAEKINPF
ncbi:MAG: type VI secretion system tube protein TssD [Lepagella sp.]